MATVAHKFEKQVCMSDFVIFENGNGTHTIDGPDRVGPELFNTTADAEDRRIHRLVEFISPVQSTLMYDDLYHY